MISLGGVIGQGLFLSAGGNLHAAGPAGRFFLYEANICSRQPLNIFFGVFAGALLAYAIIGFIVFWVTFSLGEMATYIPVSNLICYKAANVYQFQQF